MILIPKSANKDRMAQNIDIFDFQLSAEDREIISQMDERKPLIFDQRNPEMIEFLLSIV